MVALAVSSCALYFSIAPRPALRNSTCRRKGRQESLSDMVWMALVLALVLALAWKVLPFYFSCFGLDFGKYLYTSEYC